MNWNKHLRPAGRSYDEVKAYSRGYGAALHKNWPAHRPPLPPDPVVRAMMEALTALRDGVDTFIATLDPNDDVTLALGPLVDAADAAMGEVTRYLSNRPE